MVSISFETPWAASSASEPASDRSWCSARAGLTSSRNRGSTIFLNHVCGPSLRLHLGDSSTHCHVLILEPIARSFGSFGSAVLPARKLSMELYSRSLKQLGRKCIDYDIWKHPLKTPHMTLVEIQQIWRYMGAGISIASYNAFLIPIYSSLSFINHGQDFNGLLVTYFVALCMHCKANILGVARV